MKSLSRSLEENIKSGYEHILTDDLFDSLNSRQIFALLHNDLIDMLEIYYTIMDMRDKANEIAPLYSGDIRKLSGDAIREGDMVEFICDVTSAMIYDDGNHGKVIISRGEIWRYLHTKTDTWPAKEGRTMFVKFSTHTWHVKPEWVKKVQA